MSAIAGIVHWDAKKVDRVELERMSNALKGLGPDRGKVMLSGQAGFAHRGMRMVPEDVFERQPLTAEGGILLVSDARIDNREDLIRRLEVPANEAKLLADSDLILKAYRKWGHHCPSFLVGFFAFAVWDSREQKLFMARDHLGRGKIYYHRSGSSLTFASAPKGLFALPRIPRRLSEKALGDHLIRNELDTRESLYEEIMMVPPAHTVVLSPERTVIDAYWRPDPEKTLRFSSEEECHEAFNALFDEVMAAQMRSIHPMGVMMSGGLDSAAVACKAARALRERNRRISTFTLVPPKGVALRPDGLFYNDETPRVQKIAAMHDNLDTHFVCPQGVSPLEGLESLFQTLDGPAGAPTFMSGRDAAHTVARQKGIRVLFNGAGGNLTFSSEGTFRLRMLLRRGELAALSRELRLFSGFTGRRMGSLVKNYLLLPQIPESLLASYHRLKNKGYAWQHHSVIHPTFVRESGAEARMREQKNIKIYWRGLDERQQRILFVANRNSGFGNGHPLMELHGIDYRDPGSDVRLFEFCLALPEDHYFRDGIPRRLARKGLAGLLPSDVLMDPSRGRQNTDWFYRVRAHLPLIRNVFEHLKSDPDVSRYLDISRMEALLDAFPTIDWTRASLDQAILCQQGLIRGIGIGRFVQWTNGTNL